MKICLVYNEFSGMKQNWINAFESKGIDYIVVNISRNDWLDKIIFGEVDLVIGLPNGALSYQKQLFDERMYVINYVLRYPIYPFYNELLIYENKRMLSYFLKSKNIPHPKTDVFYDVDEAKEFTKHINYPIVAKSNIGASGSGVHIIKNQSQAQKIIYQTFKGNGLPRRKGPNFNKKDVYKRIFSKLTDLAFVKNKLKHYKSIDDDKDRRSILFQEYVPHSFEWRTIRIGNTFMSHKKIPRNNFASGSGQKLFVPPSIELLNFIRCVTDKMNVQNAAVDVYETANETFLVNEIQTYYGKPHIMKKDNISGRYVFASNKWVFEAGDFSKNDMCDIRLDFALDLLSKNML